ncbi:DNA-directed RNA polymerase RPB5 subunit, eukaryote/virus [Trema orientale]|uniref:DNA-directed RNA polymerase RPB5 subunit, eukaryote/virus n=1 Tax=Trema orientale TaxID=63057 RepID=A0A2P5DJ27_TREOI|nr:DNA-directed RNA polymerase RPB5 subunit, eukaryote/virus [Trema orientale]
MENNESGSVERDKYYLSRRTVMEMLKDRGFSVPTSDVNFSLDDFRRIYGESPNIDLLRFSVTHLHDPSKRSLLLQLVGSRLFGVLVFKILVIFCGPDMVNLTSVRSLADQINNEDKLTGLILILENQMTDKARKSLDLLQLKLEIFQITDLLVNVTKHALKPKYQFLSDQEKQDLLKKYSIEEEQLPRMLKQDVMARYYGLEKGQVVKISHGDSDVKYRCVW